MRSVFLFLAFAASAHAQSFDLLPDNVVSALAAELSGESAKRNLEALSRQHRMRGSRQFRAAAESIVTAAKSYGLADAHIEELPADGKIFYGTQRSRPPWNAEFAELWEMKEGARVRRIASWEASPITLAQDSASGEVSSTVVDVGSGTNDADYEGKDVRGKLVLASSQPGEVAKIAVAKHGAAGIISYAQNQRTAWWGEDERLVRWGHLETFAEKQTFGFMISLKEARALQQRLRRGEAIELQAIVRAGQEPGAYEIPMATIHGTDLADQEIVFSCHLDHPRPGANDNASGCATILEVARTLQKLVSEKRIEKPRRTIRFVWPPEIEGTLAILNARPQIASRAKAAIHLDMVGGGPETKAIFHVTRGPASQPSFIYDVAQEIGAFVNRQSAAFAMTGSAKYPLVAPEGGKEALQAALVPLTLGSDHQVYSDSSFGIPAVYLNDWPDRYIHTNFDTPANIDPTKLKRAGFIAAATGYVLANASSNDAARIVASWKSAALRRVAETLEKRRTLSPDDAAATTRFAIEYERRLIDSMSRFFTIPEIVRSDADAFRQKLETLLGAPSAKRPKGVVYQRNAKIKGTMSAFGYDYFVDKYGAERAKEIRLGGEYQYEALNLVNGKRTTSEIRDVLTAIYGPVPLADVEQYLSALESIGVLSQ